MAFWREGPGGANGPVELHSMTIPVIIPSSGTIGNNGALSGITALPLQYPSCFMYFPANTIAAGVAAGLYYVVMSSTSAGQIFNNVLDFAHPAIPASPTAFVTTGPGLYTQTTAADITLQSYTLQGGRMGLNSVITFEDMWSYNNSAGAKTFKTSFGGSVFSQQAPTTTTVATLHIDVTNRGHLARQITTPLGLAGHTAGVAAVPGNLTVNTAADVVIAKTGQLAVATDFLILQRCHIELS